MKRVIILAAVLAVGLSFLTFCGGPTDREQVLEVVKNLTRLAEERDTARILDQVDEEYSDFEGRSKEETADLLNAYFTRYRGIAINILRSEVNDLSPDEAVVRADLAFSSGAAKVFRKLAMVSMDNYRLTIKLRKTGERWLVIYAEWRPLSPGELLSEPD